MVNILAKNAETVTGKRPLAVPSIGATDCKFWRYNWVPAYVFGVSPETMGVRDESVSVDEFLAVVRTHVLAGWEYLGGKI
jgi:acetylornithine deacetylase/succinyl-diaminopimelate desuccinylase-like protein